jgi:hypothetical protein
MERLKISDLEQQIESLNKEKQRIQNLSDSIQRRANDLEKSFEIKTKDFDNLNGKLVEFDAIRKELSEVKDKLASVERENLNHSKDLVKTKQHLEVRFRSVFLLNGCLKIGLQNFIIWVHVKIYILIMPGLRLKISLLLIKARSIFGTRIERSRTEAL